MAQVFLPKQCNPKTSEPTIWPSTAAAQGTSTVIGQITKELYNYDILIDGVDMQLLLLVSFTFTFFESGLSFLCYNLFSYHNFIA